MAQAQRDRGTNTPEYQLFQSNYSAISNGIAQDVEAVAAKALEKKILSAQNLASAKITEKTVFKRASDLALILLGRIEQRAGDFYVILNIMKSIETLSHLVELLEPGQSGQASGQASRQVSRQDSRHVSGQAGLPSKLAERPSNRDAFLALLPIAYEWKTIGTLLNLSHGSLGSIEKENIKEHDRLREMVARWLTTLDATWRDLIAAVKTLNKARASEIEKGWCS